MANCRWHRSGLALLALLGSSLLGLFVVGADDWVPTDGGRVGYGTSPVWWDEFDGSSLDTSIWHRENVAWSHNKELEFYSDDPQYSAVTNGTLSIKATNTATGGRAYTSARISTIESTKFHHGLFAARIRMPQGQGIWPAFWLFGTGPKYSEIDIAEMAGGTSATTTPATGSGDDRAVGTLIHFATEEGGPVTQGPGCNHHLPDGSKWSSGFHVFWLEWTSTEMWSGVDSYDQQMFVANISNLDAFEASMYVILNVAVGGSYPGSPDNTTVFPQNMEVDWVRIYAKDGEDIITSGAPTAAASSSTGATSATGSDDDGGGDGADTGDDNSTSTTSSTGTSDGDTVSSTGDDDGDNGGGGSDDDDSTGAASTGGAAGGSTTSASTGTSSGGSATASTGAASGNPSSGSTGASSGGSPATSSSASAGGGTTTSTGGAAGGNSASTSTAAGGGGGSTDASSGSSFESGTGASASTGAAAGATGSAGAATGSSASGSAGGGGGGVVTSSGSAESTSSGASEGASGGTSTTTGTESGAAGASGSGTGSATTSTGSNSQTTSTGGDGLLPSNSAPGRELSFTIVAWLIATTAVMAIVNAQI